MNFPRTRLLAICGATLALVVAGTAVASAHPSDRTDQRGPGRDRGDEQFQRGPRDGKAMLGQRGGRRGGLHGEVNRGLRGAINDRLDSFVRRETILATDAGFVTRRIDNGTTTSSTDSSLGYTLANGDSASVTTDEETHVMAINAQADEIVRRGHVRTRSVPAEIALADIEDGSEVVVWAVSQEDGSFLAQRIVVRPERPATGEDAAGEDAATEPANDSASAPAAQA
ncbi:MAG: hypothetical protein ACC726_08000 [Chloroflexota bacterium]